MIPHCWLCGGVGWFSLNDHEHVADSEDATPVQLARHPVVARAYHLRRECEHGHEPAESCSNDICEDRQFRELVRDSLGGYEPRERP